MADEFRIKAGDTFFLECQYMDDRYTPMDLTGYTIIATVITSNDVEVDTLDVEFTDTLLGKYTLSSSASNTSGWQPGSLILEIKYTLDGIVVSNDPVRFRCDK